VVRSTAMMPASVATINDWCFRVGEKPCMLRLGMPLLTLATPHIQRHGSPLQYPLDIAKPNQRGEFRAGF